MHPYYWVCVTFLQLALKERVGKGLFRNGICAKGDLEGAAKVGGAEPLLLKRQLLAW